MPSIPFPFTAKISSRKLLSLFNPLSLSLARSISVLLRLLPDRVEKKRKNTEGEEISKLNFSLSIKGIIMVAKEFTVDLNKPLVYQVGQLGEDYQEWVHQSIVSKHGPRFFENDFMELLTRTVWWIIPIVWLPVVCFSVVMAIRMGISLPQAALLVMTGMLVWTLLEYSLHRFVFHMNTKSYWTNTLHYLLHGCHHKHPMDGLRLVFPPAGTAIICFPFYGLIRLASTPSAAPAIFAGVLLGYVIYDCMHYYLHHGSPTSWLARHLKRYHLNHHFRVQTKGFGITSSLWDFVFGTLPPAPKTQKSS